MDYNPFFRTSNLERPVQGPRVMAHSFDFDADGTEIEAALDDEIMRDQISFIQSVWIDNQQNANEFVLEIGVTGQRIPVPAGVAVSAPVFAPSGPFRFKGLSAGDKTSLLFMNVPMQPFNSAGASGGSGGSVSLAPYTDSFYVSTMATGNSGPANAAALMADISAAAGRWLIVPPGTYTIGAVTIPDDCTIWFAPGAKLEPSVAGAGSKMFQATGVNVEIYNLTVDGLQKPEFCWRSDQGTLIMHDPNIINMGDPAVSGTLGTVGIFAYQSTRVIINRPYMRDFASMPDGTYSNQPGKSSMIQFYECGDCTINEPNMGGFTNNGEDNDVIHVLDLLDVGQTVNIIGGVLWADTHTRRCLKSQGGRTKCFQTTFKPFPGFVTANASGLDANATDPLSLVGRQCLNMIDHAGSLANAVLIVDSCEIRAENFVVGVAHGFGPNGRVMVTNCDIHVCRVAATRTNPENGTPQVQNTYGIFFASQGEAPIAINNRIYGGVFGLISQSNQARIESNAFHDPASQWIECGYTTATTGLQLNNNTVYTVTAGSMAATRMGVLRNVLACQINGNSLVQRGNTTHANRFLDCLVAGATGAANNNMVPAGVTGVNVGASAIQVFNAITY